MKPLPLKHWLAIEEDVARHKAAVAQNFAEARARLLPVPDPEISRQCQLQEMLATDLRRQLHASNAAWQAAQVGPFGSVGAMGSGLWSGLWS